MNPNPLQEDPAIMTEPIHVCVTCSNQFVGKFCNRCGEKVISQKDRTFVHFLHDVFHIITHADGKLFKNLRLIVVNPGLLSKNFAIGRRQPFMKPVAMFFVGNLIYFLFPFFQTFTTTLYNQVHSHPYGPLIEKTVERKLEAKGMTYDTLEKIYNEKTVGYSKLIMVILVPMFGVVYAILNVRKRRLFSDHLLLGLEYMCYTVFYNIVFLSVILAVVQYASHLLHLDVDFLFGNEWTLVLPIVLLSMLYFNFRAHRAFYGDKVVWSFLKAATFVFMMVPVIYLYRFILFYLTMFKI